MITGREYQYQFARDHIQVLADEIHENGDDCCDFEEMRVRSWAAEPQKIPYDISQWVGNCHEFLIDVFEHVATTGSRVICPGAHDYDADFDFVVFGRREAERAFLEDMSLAGYAATDSGSRLPNNECWYNRIQRHDETEWAVNVIEVMDRQQFEQWVAATQICCLLRVTDRSIRKMIFHACRGTGMHMDQLHQFDADFVNENLNTNYWETTND